jgi:hypothetical protein
VKFDSVTGVITVVAIINGIPVTHTLTTGTSWEIGESVKQMSAALIQNYQSQILSLIENTVPPGTSIGAPISPHTADPHHDDTSSGGGPN